MTSVPATDRDTDVAGGKAHRWLIRLSIGAAASLVLCLAGLAALILATSGPEPRIASPNDQVQVAISEGQDSAAAQTDLAYENAAHSQARYGHQQHEDQQRQSQHGIAAEKFAGSRTLRNFELDCHVRKQTYIDLDAGVPDDGAHFSEGSSSPTQCPNLLSRRGHRDNLLHVF